MTLDALVIDLAYREVTGAGLDIAVHVNVSATALGTRALDAAVAAALENHDIKPGQLVLEVTVTVPIGDLDEGAAAIRRLQARGVRVALDDFGAGHNSLMYLHKLPVDMVKLDRALIADTGPQHGRAVRCNPARRFTDDAMSVVTDPNVVQASHFVSALRELLREMAPKLARAEREAAGGGSSRVPHRTLAPSLPRTRPRGRSDTPSKCAGQGCARRQPDVKTCGGWVLGWGPQWCRCRGEPAMTSSLPAPMSRTRCRT